MPIYEYRCAACGHDLEVLQKMSDAPLRKCPDCGKSQLRRLVSASRFRLKGGGWYETDFKNKDEKKRNLLGSESAEAKGDTGTDAAAKTETKEVPAAKADGAADGEKPKAAPVKAKKSAAKPRARRSARA